MLCPIVEFGTMHKKFFFHDLMMVVHCSFVRYTISLKIQQEHEHLNYGY
jgi:hypothetical protein